MILGVLSETLLTIIRMAPFLLAILVFLEFISHRFGEGITGWLEKFKFWMPPLAALVALIPGCNFAIATVLLFVEGIASFGTLIASFIATSDEALYVFIPLKINPIPLMAVKFLIAVVAGLAIDRVYYRKRDYFASREATAGEICCVHHEHEAGWREMIGHAFQHTLRTLAFVFVPLFVLNYLADSLGPAKLHQIFASTGYWQPVVAGVLGLIPSCATSVTLATLYAKQLITFGAAVAGLSSASGEAILVLISHKIKPQDLTLILIVLAVISISTGFFLELVDIFR